MPDHARRHIGIDEMEGQQMLEGTGYAAGYDPAMTVRDMAAAMRNAEDRGYVMGFFSETIELNRDSVSSLTAIALNTERMVLGCTQTVRLRNPLVMAQTLTSLDELSGGRIMIAPGACTKTHATRYGLPPADPPKALEEWVQSIRAVIDGTEPDFDGEFVSFKGARLSWEPPRRRIPIYIPATSTTGLRIAGRIGDGVLLNAICSPEYTANALKIVRQANEEADRDWSEFHVAQLVNCSVEDDHQTALDAIRWEVASKFDPIQLPFIAGPKMRVGEPYIDKQDIPVFEEAHRSGGQQALIEAIPDSYVEGMTASGTPDEVVAKVERYREVGVHVPILRPAAKHQSDRLLQLFASK